MSSHQILFATDYSETSKHALEFATSLARGRGATLLIVHVSEREPAPVGELFDEEPKPDPVELAELVSVVPSDPQVKCEHEILFGEPGGVETVKPADVIVKFASEMNVDAIVMGTHTGPGLFVFLDEFQMARMGLVGAMRRLVAKNKV